MLIAGPAGARTQWTTEGVRRDSGTRVLYLSKHATPARRQGRAPWALWLHGAMRLPVAVRRYPAWGASSTGRPGQATWQADQTETTVRPGRPAGPRGQVVGASRSRSLVRRQLAFCRQSPSLRCGKTLPSSVCKSGACLEGWNLPIGRLVEFPVVCPRHWLRQGAVPATMRITRCFRATRTTRLSRVTKFDLTHPLTRALHCLSLMSGSPLVRGALPGLSHKAASPGPRMSSVGPGSSPCRGSASPCPCAVLCGPMAGRRGPRREEGRPLRGSSDGQPRPCPTSAVPPRIRSRVVAGCRPAMPLCVWLGDVPAGVDDDQGYCWSTCCHGKPTGDLVTPDRRVGNLGPLRGGWPSLPYPI